MIDSTHLKVHRTIASLLKGGDSPRCIGRTKGGLNSKLHAVCDGSGRPIILLLTEGQMSEHKGASLIFHALPDAEALIADKGYDSEASVAEHSPTEASAPASRLGKSAAHR